ncbi:unnamed protein product [Closterium sp. Naga37s-1]|nr:unnamed protein product [Closterium sp. Naga37s-1]
MTDTTRVDDERVALKTAPREESRLMERLEKLQVPSDCEGLVQEEEQTLVDGAEGMEDYGARETLRLLSRADMVHYLDVRGGCDLKACECCFDRAVSSRAQCALDMADLSSFRREMKNSLSDYVPADPHPRASWSELEWEMRYPVRESERLQGMAAVEELKRKAAFAPLQCAEAMILEWMAEPRVGVLMDLGRYRRAVSFAAFLVLVASSPCIVTLWKAQKELSGTTYPRMAIVLGVTRQEQLDCLASMLVQVLGVKESAELKEGFGFFVQHVLSSGLEKAHAKRKEGAEGNTFQKTQNREIEKRGAGDGGKGNAGEKKGGRDGKDGDWKKHLKGRVWDRYVDGMAWILERGGAEWRQFGCTHCQMGGGSGGGSGSIDGLGCRGNKEGRNIPKGMYVSGVGATDFAFTVATLLSKAESCPEAQVFILDGNNVSKTRVEDAAIEEARVRLERERPRRYRQRRDRRRRETSETGRGCGATGAGGGVAAGHAPADAAAAAEAPPLLAASSPGAAPSAGAPTSAASSAVSTAVRVPVNSNPFLAAFTYRVSCILQWVRIYGSDSMSAKQCFKDTPQEHNLPIRHPFHDLPSLLVRFGAIPKPLVGAEHFCEWDEWPQGSEDAMKFPDDPNARFFGLGIVEESEEREESEASAESEAREDEEEQGEGGEQTSVKAPRRGEGSKRKGGRGRSGGRRGATSHKGGGRGGRSNWGGRSQRSHINAPTPVGGMLTSRKELPIAHCRADIDFIVDVASRLFPPPACAECASCFSRYKSAIPFAAVVANFAYLPASVLFNRFVYVFPPPSLEITQLADALCLYDPSFSYLPIRLHLPEVRDLAEKLPMLLLLVIALKWAREIAMVHGRLGAEGRVGEQKSSKGRRAGSGRNGVGKEEEGEEENEEDVWKAWEEVRSWCATAVMAWPASVRDGRKWYDPASISAGLSLDCKGSTEPQREEVTGQMMIDMFRAATQTRPLLQYQTMQVHKLRFQKLLVMLLTRGIRAVLRDVTG